MTCEFLSDPRNVQPASESKAPEPYCAIKANASLAGLFHADRKAYGNDDDWYVLAALWVRGQNDPVSREAALQYADENLKQWRDEK